jgi:hypothetical protein
MLPLCLVARWATTREGANSISSSVLHRTGDVSCAHHWCRLLAVYRWHQSLPSALRKTHPSPVSLFSVTRGLVGLSFFFVINTLSCLMMDRPPGPQIKNWQSSSQTESCDHQSKQHFWIFCIEQKKLNIWKLPETKWVASSNSFWYTMIWENLFLLSTYEKMHRHHYSNHNQ